jgi:NitT/TauT family transport system permease protein
VSAETTSLREAPQGAAAASPARKIGRLERWRRDYSLPLLTFVGLLALWELICTGLKVPEVFLPAPSAIVSAGLANASRLAPHYRATVYEALLGYVIAVAISVPLAMFIAYVPFLRRTVYPGLVFLDEVPKVAFAPLLITWFGFGAQPAIILTTVICIFPIFIEAVHGFESISQEILYLARSTGAGAWKMFWKIQLFNALPYIFVGLKYGGSAALIGAVVAEFLAADEGLGFFLAFTLRRAQMALGFSAIVLMASIGLALFFGMSLIERLVIPWHVSQRAARHDRIEG